MTRLISISALLIIATCLIEESTSLSPWAAMGVTCEREAIEVTIRNEIGCSKSGVRVKFCRGTCRSASMFVHHYPYFKSACRCCRKLQTERRPVLLTCPDGSHKVKFIEYAKRCGCQDCVY